MNKQKLLWIFPITTITILSAFIVWFPHTTLICGNSMSPTLKNNDIIVTISRCYNIGRFDVVIFKDEEFGGLLIKRVIGLPGETIEYNANILKIDNKIIQENFTFNQQTTKINRLVLGQDEYFVMGDNRDNSFDSREFGPIKAGQIKGKMLIRVKH